MIDSMNPELAGLLKIVLPSLFTLIAAYIGIKYGLEQVRIQKRIDFIERQLKEFYSPLLGCYKEISAKSKLREEVSQAAAEAWKEVCETTPRPCRNHDKKFEPYKKITEYNNKQLKEELLPLYRNMLSIFRKNYWLAEQETCKWYLELCNFVELWNRWMSDSIPAEVIQKLNHTEERLKPFYQELESRIAILRNKLPK